MWMEGSYTWAWKLGVTERKAALFRRTTRNLHAQIDSAVIRGNVDGRINTGTQCAPQQETKMRSVCSPIDGSKCNRNYD